MTQTRIAMVTPGSFPVPSPMSSSVERVVEELAPHLAASGLDVTVHGRKGRKQPAGESLRGVRYVRHPYRVPGGGLVYPGAVARRVGRDEPHIVQVENRPLYALRLKRGNPARRVWLALHSTSFIGPRIGRRTLRHCFEACDRLVVNSSWLADAVTARVPEAAAKLRVVHLGVDTGRFVSRFSEAGAAIRTAFRQQNGWRHRTIVLFMGRLIPKKGAHHLIRVLPRIADAHPEVLFLIVGSPHYGSHRETVYSRRLKQTAAPHAAHIRFIPYVPYPEVPNWFLAADMAVVPSGNAEAFGLVNVEAMAAGLPVIATGAGGIVEIVSEGETGFLLPPHDMEPVLTERLMRLLGDDGLRERMGRAGRLAVEERFTWRHAAGRWLALLEENAGE